MLLTDYNNKPIFAGREERGIALGIGFSLKTQAVKCILCASSGQKIPTYAVGISAVKSITEYITLHRLRSILPTNCARLTVGMPIYAHDGGYLGQLIDAEIQNHTLLRLFTDRGELLPATLIVACNDAIFLRKNQPFPLGQRVHGTVISQICDKTDGLVTRPLLRAAMAKGALIKLTLSLPPFSLQD